MPRSVSTNKHVGSKKNDLNNVSVRKYKPIEGGLGPGTEPSRAGRQDNGDGARAWGDTDLAWRRSSLFHKSGVPLRAQTHLRGSTI